MHTQCGRFIFNSIKTVGNVAKCDSVKQITKQIQGEVIKHDYGNKKMPSNL